MPTPKTIVLTGATRGLGRALVTRFTAAGHTVWGCGRSIADVAALATGFPEPNHFAEVDVADPSAVDAWARDRLATGLVPDLIINNAGLMNRTAPLWEVPAAEFGRVMDVNVDGTQNVIRAFVPALIQAGRGVVANLSSGWGRAASPEVGPYCASKFAVEGLTRSLALELPQPLAAVTVNPGIIDTDMLRSCWAASAAAYPGPDRWAAAAADFFLQLGPKDNGRALSI
jgi:NAD(P)-dependent dehydrogenase (short-subunit alcohol dehydrogenase family)